MKNHFVAGSAIALAAASIPSPALAQEVCTTLSAGATSATASGTATGTSSLACGAGSMATNSSSTAIGKGAQASGPSSVAVGDIAGAEGGRSTAVGHNAWSHADDSTAIGQLAWALGYGSTTVGSYGLATGDYATAVGLGADALGHNSVAVGAYASAAGDGSLAIGTYASDGGFAGSVALGTGSIVTADNQVNVGDRMISGVAAGDLSATSTDAVNGAQLYATNEALAGLLAVNAMTTKTQMAALEVAVSSIASDLTDVRLDMDKLIGLRSGDRRDMKQGIASAVAIANAPMPSAPGKISYALNGATFRGERAVGGSVMYRVPGPKAFAIGGAFSYAGRKNNAARIGVSGEF